MNIASIIVQGGLAHEAAKNYDEKQSANTYAQRARQYGTRLMDEDEADRPAQREIKSLKTQLLKSEYEYDARTKPQERAQQDAMRPGKYDLEFGKQQDELAEAREKQVARIYQLFSAGDAQGAAAFLTTSRMVAPGRKFAGIERIAGAARGDDGQPVVGEDGKPATQRVIRFKAADDKGDMFVPEDALEALVDKHNSKVEKVGNSLVRVGPRGARAIFTEPKQTTVAPGAAIAIDGKITETNLLGLQEKGAQDRDKLDYEYGLKKELESFKAKNGEGRATALIQNMDHLVKSGVATSHADAFNKLKTTTGRSEEDAILSLAQNLAKTPGYRGSQGMQKAMTDATSMVRSIRGGPQTSQPSGGAGATGSTSTPRTAESVKEAFRAGRIDRKSAEQILRRDFGYQ